jgi:hypothetical protein
MAVRSLRAALRPADPGISRPTLFGRWFSTLAPNLVYGSLGWVDPDEAVPVPGAAPAAAFPAPARAPARDEIAA